MLRRSLALLAAVVIGTLSVTAEPPALKNPPLTISAPYLPSLLHPKVPGPYNDLMDELLVPFGTDIQVGFAPIRRSIRQFFRGDVDCFFAGNTTQIFLRDSLYKGDDLLTTTPFKHINVRVYTAPGMPLVTSLNDLDGRTVTADTGIGGDDRIKNLLQGTEQIISANGALAAHTLVKQGRVYAAVIADYDYTLALADAPGEQMLAFDGSFQLERFGDTLLCRKTPDTMILTDYVNKRLTEMQASGQLADILTPEPGRSERQFATRPHPYLRPERDEPDNMTTNKH